MSESESESECLCVPVCACVCELALLAFACSSPPALIRASGCLFVLLRQLEEQQKKAQSSERDMDRRHSIVGEYNVGAAACWL